MNTLAPLENPEARAMPPPLRCLLVEDSQFDRAMLHRATKEAGLGIELVDVSTLSEARSALGRQIFALMIIDFRLPDGDGLQLVRDRLSAGMPVILISGISDDKLAESARVAGCDAFLAKHELSAARLGELLLPFTAARRSAPDVTLTGTARRTARMRSNIARLVAVAADIGGDRSVAPGSDLARGIDEVAEIALALLLDVETDERYGPALLA